MTRKVSSQDVEKARKRNVLNSKGKPSLAETHPELAAQADGWDPSRVSSGMGMIVQWKCLKEHTWNASIRNRSAGSGCPVCSNRKVIPGINDLATLRPDLAAQADGWDPTTLSPGSSKSVMWMCNLGHRYPAKVADRLKGYGCSICSGRKKKPGFNDLATTHPEIAAQAHGWDPTTYIPKSREKVQWKCELGHVWLATCNTKIKGHGCSVCTNRTVNIGFNDLATTHPEIAAQAHGWDPTTVSAGSDQIVNWKCEKGHMWSRRVASRTQGSGCPSCSNQRVEDGYNDLATTHPEIAAQAHGWDPTTVSAGSDQIVEWKCENGHIWKSRVANRKLGHGCPDCHFKIEVGHNDLATTHPEIAAQAHGWDPTTLSFGSNKRVTWLCNFGHTWKTTPAKRVKGSGCSTCSNKRLLIGFNDLVTTHPEIAAQAHGWDPTTVSAGSTKKRAWKCEFGHIWIAQPANRRNGTKCPSCTVSGFDPNKPAFLYLIDHFDLEMYQIGITNNLLERLAKHGRRGWEVIEIRGPMEGRLTQKLETDCLHALEKRGAVLGHKAAIEKFDGYSEAWTKASLTVISIKQLLDWVYEDESV